MKQIRVGDIVIDVLRKNIKNLHLAVYPPTGRVRIATPLGVEDETVRLFAISKLGWIKKHQKSFAGQTRQTIREYVSGESHYFEARRYLLNVVSQTGKPKVEIRSKTHINLYIREDSTKQQREKVLNAWYRKNLTVRIPPLVDKWQKIIGVKIEGWKIRRMRTKWGSCHIEAKSILFNLELAKKSLHSLEYIVVHELVHLIERRHSERYINLMDKFLPNWRNHRDELNKSILSYENWINN